MFVDYALFDLATGYVMRAGTCYDTDLKLQVLDGAVAVEGSFERTTHYYANGTVVAYTPEQRALRASNPRKPSVWSNAAMAWVDARTIAHAKADAWARIKAERERRLAGTFTHAGHTYDIDPVNLSGASIDAREALIAGESWSQMWVLANNTTVTLTATEMIAAGRACKTVVSNLWATSQHLRGLIEAATTIAQVEAIAWP